MTIDEAIKHCEEVAEYNENELSHIDVYNAELAGDASRCVECAADHRQIAEWLRELKEAKRLLKLAVEDLHYLECHTVDEEGSCLISNRGEKINCFECPFNNNGRVDEKCIWNHEAEAEKLLKQ